ncbi:cobyrinate a,c-diamide synthase [uncultured Acetobacteroides sp.]|uniref:cobyrinate a,c-diamide synthase n=1 Tax=uncultured Acetobacteroides sp. TaxID=1760811 RepID=UPI0029F58DD7|nr:cobyrinate a,c-diamide synthase [uncultured Acetobacteroides sp.]
MNIPQFLIAAPHSGSGKTLVTLALLRLLKDRGLKVQPFKCGPDYLDTKLHEVAAGCRCYNLDLFMADADGVRGRYARQASLADVAVVEGVMGMFDGYDRQLGSSAEVTKTLGIPVVLVVNAKAMAHSVAPLLKGFATYDPEVRVAGVIFNFVGSASHYQLLKMAAEEVGVEPLGWIAKNDEFRLESRHLGLQTEDTKMVDEICDKAAHSIFTSVNIDRLLEVTASAKPTFVEQPAPSSEKIRIAVARDAAFSFSYPANIEALEPQGAITYFSPLNDERLPDADFVYLPGGYPELYAEQLSANHAMMESIRSYCSSGGAMLAECGGMIYLGSHLTLKDGTCYPMVGIFDFGTTFRDAKCTLGYRKAMLGGVEVRGHEFHYSRSEGELPASVAEVLSATNNPCSTGIYLKKRTLASYFHFFWGDGGFSMLEVIDKIYRSGAFDSMGKKKE